MLEARPHQAVDRRQHFGIVQAILRLPLELRLLEEHRQDAGHAFANVFGGQRHALRRQVVRLDVVAHRLAEAGAETVLVRAAAAGGNAVDVTAEMLVGGFGPLQHELDLHAVFLLERERRFVHRLAGSLRDDLLQVVDQAFLVLEDVFLPGGLVLERHLDAAMQVAGDLETLADDLRIEFDLRKNLRIRLEVHRGAGAARGADLFQAAGGLALLEGHLVLMTVALDRGDELPRQRVDDAGADAVKAAGGLVVAGFELAAGVEHGEDHLERALLRLRVHIDGNAAAIVFDGDRVAVLVQGDPDVRRVAIHGLVDRVVERLPDQVMKAGAADAADVHAGAFPDRLEPFKDGDVLGCVI